MMILPDRNRSIDRVAAGFLALVISVGASACGPKDAGTISISAGDKTTAIEPDFGGADTGAAPAPGPGQTAEPKSIKR